MRFKKDLSKEHVSSLIFRLLLVFSLAAIAFGQEKSNQRGFNPGGSYALGDFETINMTNGNLMLQFP